MPYVKQGRRQWVVRDGRVDASSITGPGELNYAISYLIDQFLQTQSIGNNGKPNYFDINSAIGVLECAKLELYRRIAAPYEDEKIKENGDVYTI